MSDFRDSIKQHISNSDKSPLLVHSDVFRARASISATIDPKEMLSRHMEALEIIADGKSLWFPTFNYDFTRSGLYQPTKDVSQVGPLTEYARTHWATWRCGAPVFNFCGKSDFSSKIVTSGDVDPFGAHSMFALLHRLTGNILMYGAAFSSFTAIHYIERLAGGPIYRYDKVFSGFIREDGASDIGVRLIYHCRPMGKSLDYDWLRLRTDAEAEGLLSVLRVPGSEVIYIQFSELCSFWLDRLRNDPLYLLDDTSREWVSQKLDKLGRRFVVTDFE